MVPFKGVAGLLTSHFLLLESVILLAAETILPGPPPSLLRTLLFTSPSSSPLLPALVSPALMALLTPQCLQTRMSPNPQKHTFSAAQLRFYIT